MKACAAASILGTTTVLVVFAFAGCGGAAQSEAPAATPTSAEPGTAGTDPTAALGAEPASSAAPGAASAEPGAAAAEAPPADLGAGDSRTMEAIAAIVKSHRKEARECYEKALKQIPGLKGDVVIHFTLKPSGQVKEAELNRERSTITEASVASCVIAVIRSIEFPKSSKGLETAVNYPFNFNP